MMQKNELQMQIAKKITHFFLGSAQKTVGKSFPLWSHERELPTAVHELLKENESAK